VRIIYQDRQGALWIGTGEGEPAEAIPDVGGLNRLDPKKGTFTRYLHHPSDSTSLFDNKIRAILEDSQGNFWVGTRGNILHLMDRSKGTFERVNKSITLGKNPVPKLTYQEETFIPFIHEDASKALWIGTADGLHRYEPKTKQATHYPYIPNTPSPRLQDSYDTETGNITHWDTTATNLAGPRDTKPWWAFNSREGVLWISTLAGNLYKYDPFQSYIPNYELGTSVNAFYEEEDGTFWIATTKGLIQQASDTTQTQRFVHDPANSSSLDDDRVLSLYKDRQASLWVGTAKGLNRFDRQNQTFTHFAYSTKATGKAGSLAIYCMYEDQKANFYVGTRQGLFWLDRRSGTWTAYQNTFKRTSINENHILSLLEDAQGKLWIGSRSEGG
jgi:ligand-binding sensor domain-containing protein